MKYIDYLHRVLPEAASKQMSMPRHYHLIGHVILLDINEHMMEYAREIGEATLAYEPRARTVLVKVGATSGETRKPHYRYAAGDENTVTTHIENGVTFLLDPTKITFSGGNKRERISFPDRISDGETVLDMFACVGQFALPIAKRCDVNVTAIEINPLAYEFLKHNIEINDLRTRVTAILGDCRRMYSANSANRIIMGYLHGTYEYLPHAFDALYPEGGWIHLHIAIPNQEILNVIQIIHHQGTKHGYAVNINRRQIKSYAPNIAHMVFDIEASSKSA